MWLISGKHKDWAGARTTRALIRGTSDAASPCDEEDNHHVSAQQSAVRETLTSTSNQRRLGLITRQLVSLPAKQIPTIRRRPTRMTPTSTHDSFGLAKMKTLLRKTNNGACCVSITRARIEPVLSWPKSILYRDAIANGIRIDRGRIWTDSEERVAGLSSTRFLPTSVAATAGRDWLHRKGSLSATGISEASDEAQRSVGAGQTDP